MSITDVIKKSVLEKFQTSELTAAGITVTLGMALGLGLFIYLIYRVHSRSGFYNHGFNKALAILPVITAAIMLAMSSNLTISLGMVGALSIVRFRNAVKDSMDLVYLFWGISTGIIVGAGVFELALILSLLVAILIVALDLLPKLRSPSLLIVSGSGTALEPQLLEGAKEFSKFVKVSSRNASKTGVEWIFELAIRGKESELVERISRIDGVESVHLMTHDGNLRF